MKWMGLINYQILKFSVASFALLALLFPSLPMLMMFN